MRYEGLFGALSLSSVAFNSVVLHNVNEPYYNMLEISRTPCSIEIRFTNKIRLRYTKRRSRRRSGKRFYYFAVRVLLLSFYTRSIRCQQFIDIYFPGDNTVFMFESRFYRVYELQCKWICLWTVIDVHVLLSFSPVFSLFFSRSCTIIRVVFLYNVVKIVRHLWRH
jgi:hypothetical protein